MLSLIPFKKSNKIHLNFLYDLLKRKRFEISHTNLPTYNEHIEFVINHPYRYWYIIEKLNKFIGSVYLTEQNIIGLNLYSETENDYIKTIELITKLHKPLPPIKSIRSKYFQVNVNPKNNVLINALESISMIHIQNTYILRKSL